MEMTRTSKICTVIGATLAALAVALPANSQTIGCTTGGSGGPFPTAGTGDGTYPTTLPSAPLIQTLNATPPAGATILTELVLHGMTHTFIGDVQFVLEDPSGTKHNIFNRPGFGCDYSGDYTFIGPCNGGMSAPTTCGTTLPAGTYEQFFGTWPSGTNGINNTALYSIPAAAGNWTLYIYDWAAADVGNLTSWDVCFGTPPGIPVPGLPTLTSPANGATVPSPVNLQWTAASCATGYDVDVDGVVTSVATTNFNYSGSQGSHTWRVRGTNGTGPGAYTASQTFNFPAPPIPCSELATLFATNNGGSVNGQVFFDITVTNPNGITLGEVGLNASATVGTVFTLDVWTRTGTYVGNTTMTGWTNITSGTGTAMGTNLSSVADVTDVLIPAGTWGVALVLTGSGHSYTNGTGANQNYSNADLSLSAGAALNVPWVGTPFSPRVWNGVLRYNCTNNPTAYCTAGTSTHGCVPSISANAQPSVSFANACNITIANVEGQKFGIIFYGVDQTGFTPTPWAAGSNSFLCVKGPTQRTGTSNSGGTLNMCDGTLTLDWNAYQMANPSSVGNPFAAGDKVYVQGWYRDPPAAKTTNLSNALEMTQTP
jgi:subtilisin-like proprotein convertase family protein